MAPKRKARSGIGLSGRVGLLFVAPALLLFGILVLYPLVTAITYAFFEWTGPSRGEFSGIDNFTTLLTQEPYASTIKKALTHNVFLFLGAMVFQNTIGLLVATVLHRIGRFKRLFQTLFTLPYLVSSMVIGYLWSLMLSPLFGPVNATLRAIGLERFALPWLGDPSVALWVVVLVTAWQWLGFPILLYGAAIGGIPVEVEEAASLDGAVGIRLFRHVTLPLLTSAIGTVTILTFISAMESMAIPFALGGSTGSPAGSTDVLMLMFYRTAFESGNPNSIGVSSALAAVLFGFIMLVSLIIRRILTTIERRVL